jgi:hypothetical protein
VTCDKFDELLNINNYSGSLQFDTTAGTLDLVVQKGTDGNGGKTTDVKGLRYVCCSGLAMGHPQHWQVCVTQQLVFLLLCSGGERSFTTMCLLLALGDKLETPFRIFDEFDVFLDAQARKLVMQSMIHMAKKLENRQFIFITPQDLSNLTADDKLRIFKLQPPVSNVLCQLPLSSCRQF